MIWHNFWQLSRLDSKCFTNPTNKGYVWQLLCFVCDLKLLRWFVANLSGSKSAIVLICGRLFWNISCWSNSFIHGQCSFKIPSMIHRIQSSSVSNNEVSLYGMTLCPPPLFLAARERSVYVNNYRVIINLQSFPPVPVILMSLPIGICQ